MSISRLLQNETFDPEHVGAMGVALKQVLAIVGLADDDPLVETVAKTIIELGQQGIRNVDQLRDSAINRITGRGRMTIGWTR